MAWWWYFEKVVAAYKFGDFKIYDKVEIYNDNEDLPTIAVKSRNRFNKYNEVKSSDDREVFTEAKIKFEMF
ncbi:MAG: hypothetical protein LBU73_05315 [Helicobacteraceae bacterium]|nr:hypothetical protein [Helicobacteraceae bacterium]